MGTPRCSNLEGMKFGRWTVISRAPNKEGPSQALARWNCCCDCGTKGTVFAMSLKGGGSKSCGCLKAELTSARYRNHTGLHRKAYQTWSGIQQRCHNPKEKNFHNYGGRGIVVCGRWRGSFEAFLSDMGDPPSKNIRSTASTTMEITSRGIAGGQPHSFRTGTKEPTGNSSGGGASW